MQKGGKVFVSLYFVLFILFLFIMFCKTASDLMYFTGIVMYHFSLWYMLLFVELLLSHLMRQYEIQSNISQGKTVFGMQRSQTQVSKCIIY